VGFILVSPVSAGRAPYLRAFRDQFNARVHKVSTLGVLRDHLSVARADLDRFVFPDSAGAAPLEGLLRAETAAAG